MSKLNKASKNQKKELWVPALDPKTLSPVKDLMVSNLGKVRRNAREITIKAGHIRNYSAVESKGTLLKTGYVTAFGYAVHRLIYSSFMKEKINYGFVVHHKDNDRKNNSLSNLEKITYSMNNEAKRRKPSSQPKKNRKWRGQKERDVISGEQWKVIPGFLNYDISDLGRIYSSHNGGKMMALTPSNGYLTVKLSKGKRDYDTFSIHRLVYATFTGEIPKGHVVHHIDHNKENNRLGNLKCVTYSENTKAAVTAGVLNPAGKTLVQTEKLKKALLQGTSVDEIVAELEFSRSHVNKIKRKLGFGCRQYNDKESIDMAISLYKQGQSYLEISVKTGLNKDYLPKLMGRKGLSSSRIIPKEVKQGIIFDLKNSPSDSMKKIAFKHNVSKTTVQDLNKKNAIRKK